MQILVLVAAMIVVGLIVGIIAGLIWKDNHPIGVRGDYIVAVIAAVVIGLLDWYVITAMGLESWRILAVALEPPLGSLAVLWVIRLARR